MSIIAYINILTVPPQCKTQYRDIKHNTHIKNTIQTSKTQYAHPKTQYTYPKHNTHIQNTIHILKTQYYGGPQVQNTLTLAETKHMTQNTT